MMALPLFQVNGTSLIGCSHTKAVRILKQISGSVVLTISRWLLWVLFPELCVSYCSQNCVSVEDVPLVEFMYLVFSHMPGESYNRWLRSLLCLCDIFGALMNSLVCWFCASVSKEQCAACGKLLSAYRMVNCVYIMYMFAYLHVHYQPCRSYYITIVSCCFWYVICKSVFITHWARIKE